MQRAWALSPPLSFIICPYHPSFLAGPLDCIQCPHGTDIYIYKSLLHGQHWHVHLLESSRENCLRVCPCFSNAQHVLFIFLGCSVWWEACGCTAALLWHAISRIIFEQQVAFSGRSYLDFSICFLLLSKWCIRTNTVIAWKKPHFILSERSGYHMINNLQVAVNAFPMPELTLLSVDKILQPRYVNWCTNFRALSLKVEIAPSCLKHMNSALFAFTYRPMPSAAFSRLFSEDSIWQLYLRKAIDHLRCLRPLLFLSDILSFLMGNFYFIKSIVVRST